MAQAHQWQFELTTVTSMNLMKMLIFAAILPVG
jgi:hypothetical protein